MVYDLSELKRATKHTHHPQDPPAMFSMAFVGVVLGLWGSIHSEVGTTELTESFRGELSSGGGGGIKSHLPSRSHVSDDKSLSMT